MIGSRNRHFAQPHWIAQYRPSNLIISRYHQAGRLDLGAVICLLLLAAVDWGVLGRIPTRVSGEWDFDQHGDRVVNAVSSAAGRLASVSVVVGDHVVRGQGRVLAHILEKFVAKARLWLRFAQWSRNTPSMARSSAGLISRECATVTE